MLKHKYYEFVRVSKEPYHVRRKMVLYAQKHGIKPAAREFSTTPKTVRKWLQRWQSGNHKLLEESRRPKSNPLTIEKQYERLIKFECQRIKEKKKRTDARKIKARLNIPYSSNTIRRVMKKHGFARLNKKKTERKRDLREIKSRLKAFEKVQVDTKQLDDIPEMYEEYIVHKLPKYQYTARCVRTGALFVAYANENNTWNAGIFAMLVMRHLKRNRVNTSKIKIQTDNGVEYIRNIRTDKKSFFTTIVENRFSAEHRLIPPGAKTWQSDVETSHRLIEDELYSYEEFSSMESFLKKSYEYVLDFNMHRYNSYKEGTPLQIAKNIAPNINEKVFDFKPVLLGDYSEEFIEFLRGRIA